MMNAEMVRQRVEKIRAMAGDDEAAHGEEDNLREDLLRAIANGECVNPQDCAQIALTTNDIDFARWCA
jgi:hypothetical protein